MSAWTEPLGFVTRQVTGVIHGASRSACRHASDSAPSRFRQSPKLQEYVCAPHAKRVAAAGEGVDENAEADRLTLLAWSAGRSTLQPLGASLPQEEIVARRHLAVVDAIQLNEPVDRAGAGIVRHSEVNRALRGSRSERVLHGSDR